MATTKITLPDIGDIHIASTYLVNKNWRSSTKNDSVPDNWHNHRVVVSFNGKRTSFEFWASIASPELRSKSDLLGALVMFLDDGLSGQDSFDEFCYNLGYDQDSIQAHKTWQACKRAGNRARRVFGDQDTIDSIYLGLEDYR